jgi:hypothetical protein
MYIKDKNVLQTSNHIKKNISLLKKIFARILIIEKNLIDE